MDGGIASALISIAMLVIVNIVVGAYNYGRLTQKVVDLCERLSKLEKALNHK